MTQPSQIALVLHLVREDASWWIVVTSDVELRARIARVPDAIVADLLASLARDGGEA